MADILKFMSRSRARIDTDSAWEIRQWCIKFGCSEKQLKNAVTEAGVFADDVEQQMRQKLPVAAWELR